MESKEYVEKVMQDYNQNRKGRSLRKYCKDEAVDYDWLIEFKKSYRSSVLTCLQLQNCCVKCHSHAELHFSNNLLFEFHTN